MFADGPFRRRRPHRLALRLTMVVLLAARTAVENAVAPQFAKCERVTYTKTYGKEYGVFNSPDYPRPYPPSDRCLLYAFLADDARHIVEVAFDDFDVGHSNRRCESGDGDGDGDGDHVKVYAHVEGGRVDERTPWDRVLCGGYADIASTFYSSVPALVLQFRTGRRRRLHSNSSGFVGTFRFLRKEMFESDGEAVASTRCDRRFESGGNSLRGRFYSPRYPASYPQSARCFYRFAARADERVELTFEEATFQKGDENCINRRDVLKVYDGVDTDADVIAVLCNEISAARVFSTGPNLLVELAANDRWPGRGFAASYRFYANAPAPAPVHFQQLRQSDSCDRLVLSDRSGGATLSSPSLARRPLPTNARCVYAFHAYGRQRILVRIAFAEARSSDSASDQRRPHTNCSRSDSMVVYDGTDGARRVCEEEGGQPVRIMSSGATLALQFLAAHSAAFQLRYDFVSDFGIGGGRQLSLLPCAFHFADESWASADRTFASPNYPAFYPHRTECHYFFYGQPGQRVRIAFHHFDVHGVSPCEQRSRSDYVELSNYMAHDRSFAARYCGNLSAFAVSSRRNFFRVSFRSDGALHGRGFRATYRFWSDAAADHRRQLPDQPNSGPRVAIADFILDDILVVKLFAWLSCAVAAFGGAYPY